MEDIANIKIGVIIIGMSLLTLIYPLTYNFIASLLRDLFELKKLARTKNVSLPEKALNRIYRYRHLMGYVLTIFFLTGIAFILQFILLQYREEEHLVNGIIEAMPLIVLVVLMVLSFILVFFEITDMRYWIWGFAIAIGYVTVGMILLRCGIVRNIPESQIYCCLLNTGFLLFYTLCVWFVLGFCHKPIHVLGKLRETLLEQIWPAKNPAIQCLFCAETIQAAAIKCRYCGESLNTKKARDIAAGQNLDTQPEKKDNESSSVS